MGNPMFLAGKEEVEVRGAVDRRMDKHMTAHLHVGTGIASAARKKSMTFYPPPPRFFTRLL